MRLNGLDGIRISSIFYRIILTSLAFTLSHWYCMLSVDLYSCLIWLIVDLQSSRMKKTEMEKLLTSSHCILSILLLNTNIASNLMCHMQYDSICWPILILHLSIYHFMTLRVPWWWSQGYVLYPLFLPNVDAETKGSMGISYLQFSTNGTLASRKRDWRLIWLI